MTSRTIPDLAARRSFLREVVGKPYRKGADGPEAFDCYGLARLALSRLYGLALPANRHFPVNHREWKRLHRPEDGCIAMMGACSIQRHVGVFIGPLILHALEDTGVILDDEPSLMFRGFSRLRFYTPA